MVITNGTGATQSTYVQGSLVDEPLAMLSSSLVSYHEADALGSITSLSNAAGVLVQTYSNDSFGNTTAATGSLTNPFRFTAREFDSETNIVYYRARYFDSITGRFITEDPLRFRAAANFYPYVGNDPVDLYDPLGLTVEVRCRTLGPRNLLSQSWWNALKDVGARYLLGAKHCFLAVNCGGGPLTIVSYLGNGVNVVNQSVSGAVNNDVQYSNARRLRRLFCSEPNPRVLPV